MYYPVLLIVFLAVIEMTGSLKLFWDQRKLLAWPIMICLAAATIWLIGGWYNRIWPDVMAVISLYRLFNIARWGFSRLPPVHLLKVVRLSTFKLTIAQVLVVGVVWFGAHFRFLGHVAWLGLAVVQLLAAAIILISTRRHFQASKRINDVQPSDDQHLPTLTVAIPARNETESLNQCLMSLVACNYPKLEVLVLDDQSTTTRTPEIIRAFAHDGVMFMAGQLPPSGWLAKNYAYQQLLEAANGDVVLFCGADTRFEPQSLRFLVASLVSRQKTLESVVPKNVIAPKVAGRILQPLRYAWEICLPRRYVRQPPVLSTCWLAERSFLVKHGGFKAVMGSVIVEEYFARQAIRDDGYSFFRYDGILSAKTPDEQLETAIRVRYPQLHHRPEAVAAVTLAELALIIAALPLMITALLVSAWPVFAVSLAAACLYSYIYGRIVWLTYRRTIAGSVWLWPAAMVADIWLLQLSMYRYEFGKVYWRGRLVDTSV